MKPESAIKFMVAVAVLLLLLACFAIVRAMAIPLQRGSQARPSTVTDAPHVDRHGRPCAMAQFGNALSYIDCQNRRGK